jgi:hypothetical protein
MKPIRTKTSNRTYTGEGCLPLPATVIQFSDGKIATEPRTNGGANAYR